MSQLHRPAPEQGFSLLEMLVALAVFSLAALALVNLAGENAKSAGVVEQRMLAAVVAENRAIATLTAADVIAGDASGTEEQAGRLWNWSERITETEDAGILRVDIAVREAGAEQVVADLTLFRSAR